MEQNLRRMRNERENRHENEDRDDECTDGICNPQVVFLNEKGGEDDSHTAESICKDVKENAMHIVVLVVSKRDNSLHGRDGHDDGRDDHVHDYAHDYAHDYVHVRDHDQHG